MNLVRALNMAWMMGCRHEAAAFRTATRNVAETQAQVLAEIVRYNQETEFGRLHGFAAIRDPLAYQQRVPLSRYEDYANAIERIGDGHSGVLTRDPVRLLEPTSGTTGGEKLIPFTASLRRQFQRAVAAWMYDLLRHRPALRQGRAYWSISPAMAAGRRTAGGIPIGFDDDAGYMGTLAAWIIRRLLAVPSEVARLGEMDAFRYCTLWFLLRSPDLALISVWSPTFLTALLRPLESWQDRLCSDLQNGSLTPPGLAPAAPLRRLAQRMPERASELRQIFRSHLSWPEKLRLIWPQLSLVSCWADAGAAGYVGQVRDLFPSVEIQPKGLLATEGCVSFPLLGREAPVLAVRSHFFEFEETDSGGDIRLAHELDAGGRYRVILSTAGGLYRYQLRDEVEVCGFEEQCPLLRFVGKSDCVSDQVGEKLAEPHVRAVLQALFDRYGLSSAFALMVPAGGQTPGYRLYVETSADWQTMRPFASDLEKGLCENPHYTYARNLGQLRPVEVAPIGEGGWAIYERQCLARGMKAGNIKPLALDRWTGWPELLDVLCWRGRPAFRSAGQPAQAAAQIL